MMCQAFFWTSLIFYVQLIFLKPLNALNIFQQIPISPLKKSLLFGFERAYTAQLRSTLQPSVQESAQEPALAPAKVSKKPTPPVPFIIRELRHQASPVQLLFQQLGPKISAVVVALAVPIAALLGFKFTPTRRRVIATVGSSLAAVLMYLLRRPLVVARKRAAQMFLANMLAGTGKKSRQELSQADVDGVLFSYGFTVQSMEEEFLELYQLGLMEAVLIEDKNNRDIFRSDPLGLADWVAKLKIALMLPSSSAGRAHVNVAKEVAKSDERHIHSYLFISERAFNQFATESEYEHELSRLAKSFDLTFADVLRLSKEFALPYYRQILKSTLRSPESTNAMTLIKARKSLGIDPLVQANLHLEAYSTKLAEFLENKAVPEITSSEMVVLARLRGILGITQFEGDRSLEALAAPIYREAVLNALDKLVSNNTDITSLKEFLEERQSQLRISVSAANNIRKEAIRRAFISPFNAVIENLRNDDLSTILSDVQSINELGLAASKLISRTEVESVMSGILSGSPKMQVTDAERTKIFAIFVSSIIHEGVELKDSATSTAMLQLMLRLSPIEAEAIQQEVYALELPFQDNSVQPRQDQQEPSIFSLFLGNQKD